MLILRGSARRAVRNLSGETRIVGRGSPTIDEDRQDGRSPVDLYIFFFFCKYPLSGGGSNETRRNSVCVAMRG